MDVETYIPIEQCKHNHLYLIRGKFAAVGIFNEQARGFRSITPGFTVVRHKNQKTFLATEYHWDMVFGTARPLLLLEKCEFFPNDTPTGENLELQNGNLTLLDKYNNKLFYLESVTNKFQKQIREMQEFLYYLWKKWVLNNALKGKI